MKQHNTSFVFAFSLLFALFLTGTYGFAQNVSNEAGYANVTGSTNENVSGILYGAHYVEFDLTTLRIDDVVAFLTPADANAQGAVSVVGGDVYCGNGESRDLVGEVDITLNGQNGQNLRLNFEEDVLLSNPDFETGDFSGWTVTNGYIALPGDTGTGITANATIVMASAAGAPPSSGTYVVQFQIDGSVVTACGTAHGPMLESAPFSAIAGDMVSVDWRALAGTDNYHVYGYLRNTTTNVLTQIFFDMGASKPWGTTEIIIPSTGNYTFQFIGGTQDASCGNAVGATLYVDNIKIVNPKKLCAKFESMVKRP